MPTKKENNFNFESSLKNNVINVKKNQSGLIVKKLLYFYYKLSNNVISSLTIDDFLKKFYEYIIYKLEDDRLILL